jgi:hypothetical protein
MSATTSDQTKTPDPGYAGGSLPDADPVSVADLGDVQGTIPTADDLGDLERPYQAFLKAEWWAIIARGSLAFRFGPYTGPEIGKIMTRCQAEKIACLITGNCGQEFDWDLARDLCGVAEFSPAKAEGGAAC